MVQREILFLQIGNVQLCMYAALYKRKRSFCKNVNFGLVVLPFYYGSCFNASMLRYTCKFILYLKSYFGQKNRPKPVSTTLCNVLCRPAHVSMKS